MKIGQGIQYLGFFLLYVVHGWGILIVNVVGGGIFDRGICRENEHCV